MRSTSAGDRSFLADQSFSVKKEKWVGGYSNARRTECATKRVCGRPKTKLAEGKILKRRNCLSIKINSMKQIFASFITKPLKCKICPSFAAANDYLKILHYSAVFIIGHYQNSSPWKCLPTFKIFDYWNLIGWYIFLSICSFAHEGFHQMILLTEQRSEVIDDWLTGSKRRSLRAKFRN